MKIQVMYVVVYTNCMYIIYTLFADDAITERMLIKNQGQIEATKKSIDKYFILKEMYPEFFKPEIVNASSDAIKKYSKSL